MSDKRVGFRGEGYSNAELLINFQRWMLVVSQSDRVSDRAIGRALGFDHNVVRRARGASVWRDGNAARRVCYALGDLIWKLDVEDLLAWSDAVASGERLSALEMTEALEAAARGELDAGADSAGVDSADAGAVGAVAGDADSVGAAGDAADAGVGDAADAARIMDAGVVAAEVAAGSAVGAADSAVGGAGVMNGGAGSAPDDLPDSASAGAVSADAFAGSDAGDTAPAAADSAADAAADVDAGDDVPVVDGVAPDGADAAVGDEVLRDALLGDADLSVADSGDDSGIPVGNTGESAGEPAGDIGGGASGDARAMGVDEGAEGAGVDAGDDAGVAGAPAGVGAGDAAPDVARAGATGDSAGMSADVRGAASSGDASAGAGASVDAAVAGGVDGGAGVSAAPVGGVSSPGGGVAAPNDGEGIASDISGASGSARSAGDVSSAGVTRVDGDVDGGTVRAVSQGRKRGWFRRKRSAGVSGVSRAVGVLGVSAPGDVGAASGGAELDDAPVGASSRGGVSAAGDVAPGGVSAGAGRSDAGAFGAGHLGASGADSAGDEGAGAAGAGASAAANAGVGSSAAGSAGGFGGSGSAGADAGADPLGIDPAVLDIRRRMEQWTKKSDGDAARAEWEAREDPEGEIAALRRLVEQSDDLAVIARCCAGPVLLEIPGLSIEDARASALMKIDGWTPTGGGDRPPGLHGDAPLLFHLGVECSYADEGARRVAFAPNLAYEDESGYSAVRMRYGLTPYDRMARYFCADYLERPKRAGFFRHSNRLPERPYPDSDWFFGSVGLPRPGGVWMPSIAEVAVFYYMAREMIEGFAGTAGEESAYVEFLRLLSLECQYLLFDPDYWVTMHYHQEGKSIGGSTRVFERQTIADQIRIADRTLARLRRRRRMRRVGRAASWPVRALLDRFGDGAGVEEWVVGASDWEPLELGWDRRDRTRWYELGVGALSEQGDGWLAQLPDGMAWVWGWVPMPRVRSVPGAGERLYSHGKWRAPRNLG